MTHAPRSALTFILSVALAAALPGAAGAGLRQSPAGAAGSAIVLHVEELRLTGDWSSASPQRGADLQATSAAFVAPGPCKDGAYNLAGGKWASTYRWSFRASSTPSGLRKGAVEAAIRRGVSNIVTARNDCGRADNVAARAKYLGRTTAKPSCNRTDGRNVVGFRALATDVAARACWWTSGNRIVEADIQVNSTIGWATSTAGCVNQLMVEAVITHEAGHVFGVGHVGEKRHGRLTMSTYIDGPCNNQESTLGLGDMRALEALYP